MDTKLLRDECMMRYLIYINMEIYCNVIITSLYNYI